jgi:hypothetical protein
MSSDETPKAWPFVCPHCKQPSNAVVRGKAHWEGRDGSEGPPVEWTLVQCDRCFEPTLQAREDFGGGFSEDHNPATVYPPAAAPQPKRARRAAA